MYPEHQISPGMHLIRMENAQWRCKIREIMYEIEEPFIRLAGAPASFLPESAWGFRQKLREVR